MFASQKNDSIRQDEPCHRNILWIVALVAITINVLSFSASNLWVTPTSMEYLELAGDLVERFDFSNELFLLRTPAYPLFLASIFWLFGSTSPIVILILQHVMVVTTVMLIAMTAWQLSHRKDITLVAGLLAAIGLQTIAFANQVMAETPYTLALVATTFYLVRYYRSGVTHKFDALNDSTLIVIATSATIHSIFRWHGSS